VPKNSDRWLDHTGLNLIRIVIGSYFMAISLGLIGGVDAAALLEPLLPVPIGALAGTGLLFVLSAGFMAGVRLRLFALSLALFLLCSSIADNWADLASGIVAPFWRDLTLVAAVLLSYASLRRREVRHAALVLRRRATRMGSGGTGLVRPRRVSFSNRRDLRRSASADYEMALRPTLPPTGPIPPVDPAPRACRADTGASRDDVEEIDNIFVNI